MSEQQQQPQQQPQQQDVHHGHDIAKVFPPMGIGHIQSAYSNTTVVTNLEQYRIAHAASIANVSEFWSAEAKERLDWFVPFTQSMGVGDFHAGDVTWFPNGKLNICYNAVDRHCLSVPSSSSSSSSSGGGCNSTNSNSTNSRADQMAMIFEGDEPDDIRRITYQQLQRKVCQISNALSCMNIRKGDVVTIYMPMIPELPMTMLACLRIGAIHSVVFAGFSAEALAQRVSAANSRIIITADVGKRGGKVIPLKDIVNECRTKLNVEQCLEHVLVWERFFDPTSTAATNEENSTSVAPYDMKPKDVRMDLLVAGQRPYSVPVWMDSEDPLFILYTSGSTGKPKGLLHTTGGYALFASYTAQTSFGLQDGDLFACVADCGWITGHSYVVYGPLLNGSTTFIFESTPVYPDAGRYWDMIERHRITQFYTAPTAIRLLMKFGDIYPSKYDTSSVRVLGTVGEPINPEAWRWYFEVVGKSKCSVVDTYWQTETGGHVVTNLPGITPMKPGSCTLPMFGIDTVVLDPVSGEPVTEPTDDLGNYQGVLAIKQPWPGMARTCLGDHARYLQTYLHVYKGYYYTGDSVIRDKDGFHFIIGRVDDVLNVSGHRIGTAEVESALVAHGAVAQAAVVGQPHEIKGTSIAAFVMLKDGHELDNEKQLIMELKQNVRSDIGSFASPDMIVIAPSLPMTRSGKIMRRILRKIVCGEADSLGDTSTLSDPSIVDVLIQKVAEYH